uniref:PEST proteolytic signal-containing nuclear protein n=1 Tax=Caenorhabditis tropicalis TaxID=1561998 RepID=A0A1I7UQH3_9PELO
MEVFGASTVSPICETMLPGPPRSRASMNRHPASDISEVQFNIIVKKPPPKNDDFDDDEENPLAKIPLKKRESKSQALRRRAPTPMPRAPTPMTAESPNKNLEQSLFAGGPGKSCYISLG